MTASGINRPYKFGERDRRLFIVQNSEVALQVENDVNGNPIFVGRAKVGTLTSQAKWEIVFITYDANQAVLSMEWPENVFGNNSADYDFVWDDRAGLVYG